MSLRLGYASGSAALEVLALVSGLPPKARMTRKMMMLQAYIDESCSDGKLFVMAGYIASAPQWIAFSEEWASWPRFPPLEKTRRVQDERNEEPARTAAKRTLLSRN